MSSEEDIYISLRLKYTRWIYGEMIVQRKYNDMTSTVIWEYNKCTMIWEYNESTMIWKYNDVIAEMWISIIIQDYMAII